MPPDPTQLEKNALDHARALVRVKHAAVVQVLAVERQTHPETGADALCIVMEFVDGPNLSLHKRTYRPRGAPFNELLSRALLPSKVDRSNRIDPIPAQDDASSHTHGSLQENPGRGASPLTRWRTMRPHVRLLALVGGALLLAGLGRAAWSLAQADPQTSLVYDAQERACKSGDLRGCVDQGNSLCTGRGVERDPVRAFELFSAACEAGESLGCLSRGWAHYSGTGTKKDASAAALDFERTCNDAVVSGCYGLGILYRDGTGRPKDPALAARLIKKACDGGFGPGCGK